MISYKQKYFDLKGGNDLDNVKTKDTIRFWVFNDGNPIPNHAYENLYTIIYITKDENDDSLNINVTDFKDKPFEYNIMPNLAFFGDKTPDEIKAYFLKADEKLRSRIVVCQILPNSQTPSTELGAAAAPVDLYSQIQRLESELKECNSHLATLRSQTDSKVIRVYVMRHGDRADDDAAGAEVKATVDRVEDPPLSPKGHVTARQMIDRIKIKLNGSINKIVSSPLLRCVQTAVAAREALLQEDLPTDLLDPENKIKLDFGLREVWHPKVLKRAISEVNFRTFLELSRDWSIDATILESISETGSSIEETRGIGGSADQRYRESVQRLAVESANAGHKNLLIVTHGDCLGSFVAMVAPNKSIYQVDYCGVICAEYDNKSKKWTLVNEECYGVGMMDAD